jgi:hypothetical protein
VLARKTEQPREQHTTRRKISEASDVVRADVYDLALRDDQFLKVKGGRKTEPTLTLRAHILSSSQGV